jgi:hypothetical protein
MNSIGSSSNISSSWAIANRFEHWQGEILGAKAILTSDRHVGQDDQPAEILECLLSLEQLLVTTHLDDDWQETQSSTNELYDIAQRRNMVEFEDYTYVIIPSTHTNGTQDSPDSLYE